jgi:hypothetical protein
MLHDHADAFMDMDSGEPAGPDETAAQSAAGSDRGAGALGFTGTVGKRGTATAAGPVCRWCRTPGVTADRIFQVTGDRMGV